MRALVAGYGRMGGFHAKALRDLGYTVTTVDPDPGRLADHTSLDGLARGFDIAAVAVPPSELLHIAYLLAGTPKLLVEKPFASNVRDASLLAAYLAQRGTEVCVGLVERFNPQARALRALIQDGTLTGITSVRFTRWNERPSFDIGLDLQLHDIDLAAWLQVAGVAEYDTRARTHKHVRTVTVTHDQGETTFDLMGHQLSPLHGLWHAFLTGAEYPKPSDIIRALDVLEHATAGSRELAAA